MRLMIVRAFAVAAALAVTGCDDAPDIPVEQVGYFKSAGNERVIAFHSDMPLTRQQVEDVVAGQVFTEGRLGRVMFYSGVDNPAPADALTLASDLPAALQLTSNPPFDRWDWAFSINPAGARSWKSNVE